MKSVLLAVAIVIGILGGIVFGGTASVVAMAHHGCIVPAEASLDPVLGAMLGGWNGPVLVDSVCRSATGARAFRLDATLHLFFDTVFGLFVGYHFVYGLNVYADQILGWEFEVERLIASLLIVYAFGKLFYWSTERWLKRMGQDESGQPSPQLIGLSHDR